MEINGATTHQKHMIRTVPSVLCKVGDQSLSPLILTGNDILRVSMFKFSEKRLL